jgi:signal transduction histidine kinase
MILDLIILLVCSVAITLLGLLIFARNPSLANNRRFALLSSAQVAWIASNYLSDYNNAHVLLYTRLTFFFGILSAFTLRNFIVNFPSSEVFHKNLILRIHSAFTILLLPVTLLPIFISSVDISNGESVIKTSYMYVFYIVYMAYSLFLMFFIIRRQYLHAKLTLQKQQVINVSYGVVLYGVFAVLSNVLLPLLSSNWSSTRFGPVCTLFLVWMMAYTIVKHRLFDIRLVIARSLGYAGALILITAIYSFGVLGVAKYIFDLHLSLAEQVFLAGATGLAGLTFQRLKVTFSRATNALFYRDAYDSQAFLEKFNKTLVTTYELRSLLQKSADIMEEVLRPSYCVFVINETPTNPRRVIGARGYPSFSEVDITLLRSITRSMHKKIIVTDILVEKYNSFQQVLQDDKIAVLARLSNSVNDDGVGYIVFGTKKSGNGYDSQDLKVIDIIANELVIAIQNALRTEEIQDFNQTLQAKVNEATRKLRRTNERLRELDESKDDFISMASHQLRTPLTSVKGYISMVLEGDAGKVTPMQGEMLGQAFFSSQRMVYLISDLLNVSRLKTGKFIIETAKVDLVQLVQQELHQLKEAAASRSLDLQFEFPKDFPTLMFDETKIRQVIMNFADNAIYYTPAGGHVTVRLVNNPSTIELRVEDDGIGVPKHEQHHMFTKFYRAGNARQARPDGTGLGLFMAKKVIIAQGGSVIFDSVEGKGSTFGFVFSKTKLAVTGEDTSLAALSSAPTKQIAKV